MPALAFLDLGRETRGVLLGAAVATTVGAIDDFRAGPGEVRRADRRRRDPAFFGSGSTTSRSRSSARSTCRPSVGIPLTMVWIVAVMNMVNFLDGLDGLAAASAGSRRTYAVLALSLGKTDPAILSAIVAGACLGFLRHNFFPARIFMGDRARSLLGFLLARRVGAGAAEDGLDGRARLPLLVLAVPILDTSFVVARRLKHGEPASRRPVAPALPLPPPRLLQRRAAVTMWAWCATLARRRSRRASSPSVRAASWHLWETLAVAVIGAVALAFSLYVVYLLEIVKLANPRRFRRSERAADERDDRRLGARTSVARTKSVGFPSRRARLSAVTSSAMLAAPMEPSADPEPQPRRAPARS